MAKSAQQKFNEYLDECHETTDAINQFINFSSDNHNGYAYSAGALSTILQEAIGQLPRSRRDEMRDRLRLMAQQQKNELLAKTLKQVV